MREIKLHKVIMDLKNRRDLINGQIDKIRKTCKHNEGLLNNGIDIELFSGLDGAGIEAIETNRSFFCANFQSK